MMQWKTIFKQQRYLGSNKIVADNSYIKTVETLTKTNGKKSDDSI